MYLDGNRLKAAAETQHLSLADVQERSGLRAEQVQYYWDYPVTITNQEDVAALARLLQVQPDDLLIQGEPGQVWLRPDKFAWQDGDIEWLY